MPAKKEKRSDGRYQAFLSLGRDESGKRKQKVFYGATQKEANAKRKAYIEEQALNRDAARMTLSKWAEEWHKIYVKGGFHNKQDVQSILNVFARFVGEKTLLQDIKPKDIQAYAKHISQFTKSHVDKVRRNLTNLFKAAVENGYILQSPCEGIVWDYAKNETREAIDQQLIDLITNNWSCGCAGVWAMFMLYAGLRPSEALALKVEHIREDGIHVIDGSGFEHGKLVIHPGETKTESGERIIPILPPLAPVIASLPSSGHVCRSSKGEPVSESAYKRNWTAFWNKLEQIHNGITPRGAGWRTDKLPDTWQHLPKIDRYDLRHTFCSMLYDADVDVKTTQYLMGHKTLDLTLKIYTHLSEKKRRRSYDKLFAHFE